MTPRAPIQWPEAVQRRLVAVAFADVVEFSKLMELDDVRTLRDWTTFLEGVVQPRIAEHHGDLLHVMGDGVLVGFQSAVEAVRWAVQLQQAVAGSRSRPKATSLAIRIGINVEDAIVGAHDLHGDGINIAARIQQLARPGEVLTTAAVRDHVGNKLPVRFDDLGEQRLRNISRAVHLFRVAGHDQGSGSFIAHSRLVCRMHPSLAGALGMALGFLLAMGFMQGSSEQRITPVLYDQGRETVQLPTAGRDANRTVDLERSSFTPTESRRRPAAE